MVVNSTGQKRNLSESIKKKVAADQKWNCKKCQSILDATYEIDHIMPLYKGGSNDIINLQALCRNCHGNKTLEDKIKYG
jgi:5-methylcytosine-specific restriction endonuclease McrA